MARTLTSQDVIETLAELSVWRATAERNRSDNEPEFRANAVREWLDVGPLFIGSESPW